VMEEKRTSKNLIEELDGVEEQLSGLQEYL
jgi:hypothetical protein